MPDLRPQPVRLQLHRLVLEDLEGFEGFEGLEGLEDLEDFGGPGGPGMKDSRIVTDQLIHLAKEDPEVKG